MSDIKTELKDLLKPQVETLLAAEKQFALASETVEISKESGDDVAAQVQQLAEIKVRLASRRAALERRGLIESV